MAVYNGQSPERDSNCSYQQEVAMPHAGSRALSAAKMLGENNAQTWRNHSRQWFTQLDCANTARKGHIN